MVWRISEGRVVRWSVGGEGVGGLVSEVLAMLGEFGCNRFCEADWEHGEQHDCGCYECFYCSIVRSKGAYRPVSSG